MAGVSQSRLYRVARPWAVALLLCSILSVVIGAWVFQLANEKALQAQRSRAESHFAAAISGLEQRWGWEAFSFKTRIESLRYLESSPRSLEKLTAHLTSLGRSIEFPLLRIEDARGDPVLSYEYLHRNPPKVWFRTGQETTWVLDEDNSHLYMVFRQPIWLGKEDGYLLLFKPMDHAALSQIGYPATRLSVWWKDRPMAASEGHDGLAIARAAARRTDDPRVIRLSWPGLDPFGAPMLMVELTAAPLLGLADLIAPLTSGLFFLAAGLFLVFWLWDRRSYRAPADRHS